MAIKIGMKPVHPGEFIRQAILPDELTVTDAAKILGVGRPALSTLLNGKASLSPEMALRVEKAFGVKMDTLLRMQACFDAAQMRSRAGAIKVKAFRYEDAA
ncbi:HigA family addiction module antitoxin [Parasphingorhabdus sp.]|uniref:HigA family addiction module antitoxin n=1 Tax=Parasphingorhabdus sp. TaxID=2709688 RepID=UPI002B26504C|nr:HigA family addiction module antitoxin [Parasphingorhabdus sp.]